uniref:Septin-type G domain-containing protein n=1 Tax=Glossina morsitans morsitans TaxID=37546 RepID=A0A1B0GE73_GLOMM
MCKTYICILKSHVNIQLDMRVDIIPVIAKADAVTKSDLQRFKASVMEELNKNKVNIYEYPTNDDGVTNVNQNMNNRVPFAVSKFCPDFVKLREILIRTNIEDMREQTHTKHYELYRRKRLGEMGFGDVEINTKPVSFQQAFAMKRSIHLSELQAKKEEILQRFEQQRITNDNLLKERQRELHAKFEQLKKEHAEEKRKLDEARIKYEEEIWALIALAAVSMEPNYQINNDKAASVEPKVSNILPFGAAGGELPNGGVVGEVEENDPKGLGVPNLTPNDADSWFAPKALNPGEAALAVPKAGVELPEVPNKQPPHTALLAELPMMEELPKPEEGAVCDAPPPNIFVGGWTDVWPKVLFPKIESPHETACCVEEPNMFVTSACLVILSPRPNIEAAVAAAAAGVEPKGLDGAELPNIEPPAAVEGETNPPSPRPPAAADVLNILPDAAAGSGEQTVAPASSPAPSALPPVADIVLPVNMD